MKLNEPVPKNFGPEDAEKIFFDLQKRDPLHFPDYLMTGLAGRFADLYSAYIEPPKVFLYFAFLTVLGSLLSYRLRLKSELKFEPRLFTLLLGESASERKSTAVQAPVRFFQEHFQNAINVSYGIGSAEGLQAKIKECEETGYDKNAQLILIFDEFRAFTSKCKIEASVLLPCVNTLFESERYESRTKSINIRIEKAHLSILAASTIQTYQNILTPQFCDIGFDNRIFLVPGQGERKNAIPEIIPVREKKFLTDEVKAIIDKVGDGLEMDLTGEAGIIFDHWYREIESSIFSKRLDTYGLRLMPLLALNDDQLIIDRDTVDKTIEIMNWQLSVRKEFFPVDAENQVAKIEQRIRRILGRKNRIPMRELRQQVGADRSGLWYFQVAIQNLSTGPIPEIKINGKICEWIN